MFQKSLRGTEPSLLWTGFTSGRKPLVGVNNVLILRAIFFLSPSLFLIVLDKKKKKKNLHLVKCEVGQS